MKFFSKSEIFSLETHAKFFHQYNMSALITGGVRPNVPIVYLRYSYITDCPQGYVSIYTDVVLGYDISAFRLLGNLWHLNICIL